MIKLNNVGYSILILFMSFCFNNKSEAQKNNLAKENVISVELSTYKSLIRSSLIFQREILKLNSVRQRFKIATISGIGLGDNGNGIDRKLKEHYFTAGFTFGVRLFSKHHVEAGLQFYYSRIKEGYLSITDMDKWMYHSFFRFTPGYRIDSDNVSFRIFVIPEFVGGDYFYGFCCPLSDRRKNEEKVDLYPGISFGIRF